MTRVFLLFVFLSLLCNQGVQAQSQGDSIIIDGRKTITLSEVVVGRNLDLSYFFKRMREDSSFYKAFRNLRVLSYMAINDIRMLGKKNELKASLHSKTLQQREKGCRRMETLEESVTGDIYNDDNTFNYYTAEMYASLFFTKGVVCGETNIIGPRQFSLYNKKGMDKHREQLKMLFFNPGNRIPGIPFISGKTDILDDDMAEYYDFTIDERMVNQISCIVFSQKVKPGKESKVIVDEMVTSFDESTFEIVSRTYNLNYDAGLFDFNVKMQVEMTKYQGLTLPVLIRYNGNWKAPFKKRERGFFTATLSDFH